MQVGEVISPPVAHTEPNEDCPFCPKSEPKKYTTYPGADNDSTKLGAIMEDPGQLTSKQSGIRPQTGRADDCGYTQEQEVPSPRKEDKTTWYTHQAHHLISGNQALKGNPIEDWILASDVNEKDTGYSVNSTGNGYWAPSVPKDFVKKWGPKKKVLSDSERQTWAEKLMKEANAQAHIGPHNITDPDDKDGDFHSSYDKYIREALDDVSNRIFDWSQVCFLCADGKDKKAQATYRVHDILDRISLHLQGKITGNRKSWDIFISKYALNYHIPVCSHKVIKT